MNILYLFVGSTSKQNRTWRDSTWKSG